MVRVENVRVVYFSDESWNRVRVFFHIYISLSLSSYTHRGKNFGDGFSLRVRRGGPRMPTRAVIYTIFRREVAEGVVVGFQVV